MPKSALAVAIVLLLAITGCAGRSGVRPADLTPSAVPKVAEAPVAGEESQVRPPESDAPAPAPPQSAAKAPAAAGEPTPATASTFVYAREQAAVAAPPSPPATEAATPDEVPGGELQLLVVASAAQVAAGEVVTADVMAVSSSAVVDAPLHLTFDPNVLEFVDGVPGDFLTRGGSSVVFLADGQSRPGDVAIAAGRVVREQGASGAGLLCRVRFRGVGAGTSPVAVGEVHAWGTAGESLTVRSTGTTVVVR